MIVVSLRGTVHKLAFRRALKRVWAIRLAIAVALAVASVVSATAAATFVAAQSACQLPPTASITDRPWAQNRLDFERVWPITTGAGVTVAVVDTGVDGSHPQLRGHVLAGYNEVNGGGTANSDCIGHGTAVAGIIAAQQQQSGGFAGVAPGAMILPVRETDDPTKGTVRDLALGIRDAVGLNAQVINVSVVTEQDDPELRSAVRYALDNDVVIVAAAGNDFGVSNVQGVADIPEYPASYPGVLGVGAVDSAGNRSSFSETKSVGVVAPGSDLVSTGAGGAGLVANQSGTSFATPFVAGAAALVRAYHPRLTAAQVVHRIEVTADHPAPADWLPDPQYGWGVVNPYAAVMAVLPEEGPLPVAVPAGTPVLQPAALTPSDHSRETAALCFAAAAVGVVVVVLAVAGILPKGRRRGWRPGSWSADHPEVE